MTKPKKSPITGSDPDLVRKRSKKLMYQDRLYPVRPVSVVVRAMVFLLIIGVLWHVVRHPPIPLQILVEFVRINWSKA